MSASDPATSTASPIASERQEPWRAVALTFLVPGLGHLMSGYPIEGAIWITLWAAILILGIGTLFFPFGNAVAGFLLFTVSLFLSLACSIEVFHRIRSRNSPEFEAERRAQGDAWRAVALSRVLPGLGQMLEGRSRSGVLLLLAALTVELWHSGLAPILSAMVSALATLDAWFRGRGRRTANVAIPVALAVAAVAIGLLPEWIKATVVRAYRVPSESMRPTFEVGDLVLTDMSKPHRAEPGDLVVFPFPQDESKTFIKRVVATGGQTFEIRDKHVFVDGVEIDEPYAVHTDPSVRSGLIDVRDNLPPHAIPAGEVFLMGDNRDNSNDSRHFGPIPVAKVQGRIYKIYWPPQRQRWFPAQGSH